MKKALLLSAMVIFAIGISQAQVKVDPERLKTNKVKQAPSKTPPPPVPVNKTTPTTEVLTYTLTSARVKIRTGNDNKEFPSKVLVHLKTKNQPITVWSPFGQTKLDNEMRINSETEFGLEKQAQSTAATGLTNFQAEGLALTILYLPNFFADAWKIENITLVLEFKDQHGNLHPTYGNKTIVFSNAYGFLNNDYRNIVCEADGNFAPLTSVIKK